MHKHTANFHQDLSCTLHHKSANSLFFGAAEHFPWKWPLPAFCQMSFFTTSLWQMSSSHNQLLSAWFLCNHCQWVDWICGFLVVLLNAWVKGVTWSKLGVSQSLKWLFEKITHNEQTLWSTFNTKHQRESDNNLQCHSHWHVVLHETVLHTCCVLRSQKASRCEGQCWTLIFLVVLCKRRKGKKRWTDVTLESQKEVHWLSGRSSGKSGMMQTCSLDKPRFESCWTILECAHHNWKKAKGWVQWKSLCVVRASSDKRCS